MITKAILCLVIVVCVLFKNWTVIGLIVGYLVGTHKDLIVDKLDSAKNSAKDKLPVDELEEEGNPFSEMSTIKMVFVLAIVFVCSLIAGIMIGCALS